MLSIKTPGLRFDLVVVEPRMFLASFVVPDATDVLPGLLPLQLSSTSLKSMCGEELRNFMVLHPDCMTSIGTSGKSFWMQMWGEYFLCIVEILDPNTGVNQVKTWRNNGYQQDSSLFKT